MGIILTTYIHLDDPPKKMPKDLWWDESRGAGYKQEDDGFYPLNGENVGVFLSQMKAPKL